jgi:probable rRNA maturation factor
MVSFEYKLDFELHNEDKTISWIETVVVDFGRRVGDIHYVFCDDDYLHKINLEYLDHDTLTDIISFDYSTNRRISGEIFISIDRVRDNAIETNNTFQDELDRVIIHGVLHYLGFKDKSKEDAQIMRNKEDYSLSLRA